MKHAQQALYQQESRLLRRASLFFLPDELREWWTCPLPALGGLTPEEAPAEDVIAWLDARAVR